MKKRLFITALSLVCATCCSFGFAFANAETTDTYEAETVKDIAEYFSSTDYMLENGVTYKAGERGFSREWLTVLLSHSCGISFTTNFKYDDWKGNEERFVITLGGNEITYSLTQTGDINIGLYNTLASEGGILGSVQLSNVDITKDNEWRIARVNTMNTSDTAYALKVYLNDELVLEKHDEESCWSSDKHAIYIDNFTSSSVVMKTTFEEKVEFIEEQNVLDIAEFDGREDLFSTEGLQIVNSTGKLSGDWKNHPLESRAVNIEWVGNYTKLSNGLQWKMKANSNWTKTGEFFRLNIGATQIHFKWFKGSSEIGVYTHTMWSEETEHLSAIAGYTKLSGSYNPTEWHKWRVVRVEATNARGYAVRFYIDDTFCAELYTSGELTDKHLNEDGTYRYSDSAKGFHAVRLVNCSGVTMSFKTSYYTRPPVEEESAVDIMTYGISTELLSENGKLFATGNSAIDSSAGLHSSFGQEWYAKSGGLEFKMKASKDWGSDYDKLKILLGATQIRINSKGDNKITMHIYNMAHDYANAWGQEYPISTSFDETQWHTIKVTRRKFLCSNGSYEEKGMQVAVYIDGEKVIETVQNLSGMWSFQNRRLAVTNNSGVDISFKSMMSKSAYDTKYAFEDEKISELYEMPQHTQKTYYEDAFGEGLEIKTGDRIINSISSEEYSSTTNGVQFTVTSKQPWKTSGTSKTPIPLTEEELATLTTIDGKEMFKENGTGDYVEVALTGLSGQKYKFSYQNWTSAWTRLAVGDGVRMKGETDQGAWVFPSLWKNTKGQIYYSQETSTLLMSEDWMATKYHMHVDFGTMTLNYKLTPDNKMVVRVYSRYTWVVMYEDYVRDENGTPIEFLTGTYTGDSSKTYNGKTLTKGDLYENTFKISKVKEVGGNGFITRLWVNGYLACEVYDTHPMGGEKMYSYLLIDNLAGTMIRAKSVATFNDLKTEQKAKLDTFAEYSYSTGNAERVAAIIAEAKANIDRMNAIMNIEEYVKATLAELESIWTQEKEQEFARKKMEYISKLEAYANNAYNTEEAEKLRSLLNEAKETINNLTENEGFAGLEAIYKEYNKNLSNILTAEEKLQMAKAQVDAKTLLNTFAEEFEEANYTSDNFAKIAQIQAKYIAKIDVCEDVLEIEALVYAARTEMWAVATK